MNDTPPDIEARLGFTLDEADGFVLTFAEPVSPKARAIGKPRHQSSFDPFSDQNMGLASAVSQSYDPFSQ